MYVWEPVFRTLVTLLRGYVNAPDNYNFFCRWHEPRLIWTNTLRNILSNEANFKLSMQNGMMEIEIGFHRTSYPGIQIIHIRIKPEAPEELDIAFVALISFFSFNSKTQNKRNLKRSCLLSQDLVPDATQFLFIRSCSFGKEIPWFIEYYVFLFFFLAGMKSSTLDMALWSEDKTDHFTSSLPSWWLMLSWWTMHWQITQFPCNLLLNSSVSAFCS